MLTWALGIAELEFVDRMLVIQREGGLNSNKSRRQWGVKGFSYTKDGAVMFF